MQSLSKQIHRSLSNTNPKGYAGSKKVYAKAIDECANVQIFKSKRYIIAVVWNQYLSDLLLIHYLHPSVTSKYLRF